MGGLCGQRQRNVEALRMLNEDKVSGVGEDRRRAGALSKGGVRGAGHHSELGMQEGIRLWWEMKSSEYL